MELSPLHTCQGVWVDVIGRKAHKREQGKGGGGINQAEFYPIPSSVSSSSKRSDDGRNLCCAAAVNLSVTRLPACSAPLSKSNENFFQIRKFRVVPKERGGEERNVRQQTLLHLKLGDYNVKPPAAGKILPWLDGIATE